ncbi:gamma-glutamyltransferase [Labilibaculum euxinus]|uniref:Glutathione hydrolase proenzyme n=1 Tax=Labilibaculum euxinus TaxID=2686357 RepID=A0A7M4D8V6_9BACT|nr:gamma-glutamyltransferase [Labilibaculum euxinus]MUP39085.1 gamma-glutamyltransferase [Labilibaculum euxinus]MVB08290.1 gamma-glutamyltransferase [Labilibaculum euxinus]
MCKTKLTSILLAFILLGFSCNVPLESKSYKNGVVVTAHYLASEVGREILQKGGNAFDAAVAVQFALAVVYPRAGNIAGGGFAVIRTSGGDYNSLDFRETAPKAAYEQMYCDEDGRVNSDLSKNGDLAVGVPGTVDGMVKLHQKYGKMDWKALLEPAIKLAENGVALSLLEANKLNDYHDQIQNQNKGKSLVPYLREGLFREGDTLSNIALSRTLSRIKASGRNGFYEGETAGLIVSEMEKHGGIITAKDLQDYQSIWRKPLLGEYRGHKIISMPPPSSGGVALVQLLKGAGMYKMNKYSFGSFEHIHLMVELERRVYADRAAWLGDPDYYEVPVNRLVDDEYLENRFAGIEMDKKTNSQDIKAGSVELIESFETTHFSIADSEGNAIAVTTTLNGNYGSKVMVEGGGFFLNNEMDDFSSKPGFPNQFGLVGGEANSIQPGKRMLSSMTPTIIEKDGKLFMVLGSPGGSTIITSVFQNIINKIDFKMNPQQVVDAPRIHSQWLPDEIYVETDFPSKEVVDKLKDLKHIVKPQSKIGTMADIFVLDSGEYIGVADTKRHKDSRASGY